MISEDEVRKIASLARLELEPGFIAVLTHHLNDILGYVEQLNGIDTAGIEPMSHVHGIFNVFRQDIIPSPNAPASIGDNSENVPTQGALPLEKVAENCPDLSGRFIRVPLIIE